MKCDFQGPHRSWTCLLAPLLSHYELAWNVSWDRWLNSPPSRTLAMWFPGYSGHCRHYSSGRKKAWKGSSCLDKAGATQECAAAGDKEALPVSVCAWVLACVISIKENAFSMILIPSKETNTARRHSLIPTLLPFVSHPLQQKAVYGHGAGS